MPEKSAFSPIPGFPGHKINSHGVVLGKRGNPLVPIKNRDGYLQVKLTLNGKSITRQIHVLVALTYLGPRPPGLIVRHIEQPRTNNHVTNLCYGTYSENNYDTVKHGNHKGSNKTHCPRRHEYTKENTYTDPRGSRQCRTCKRDKQTRARALKELKTVDSLIANLTEEERCQLMKMQ